MRAGVPAPTSSMKCSAHKFTGSRQLVLAQWSHLGTRSLTTRPSGSHEQASGWPPSQWGTQILTRWQSMAVYSRYMRYAIPVIKNSSPIILDYLKFFDVWLQSLISWIYRDIVNWHHHFMCPSSRQSLKDPWTMITLLVLHLLHGMLMDNRCTQSGSC